MLTAKFNNTSFFIIRWAGNRGEAVVVIAAAAAPQATRRRNHDVKMTDTILSDFHSGHFYSAFKA